MLYLDHCGTTPLSSDVSSVMIDFIKSGNFGNPSAEHHNLGHAAFEVVESARQNVALALGAKTSEIIFTSGAAEANNMVLWGFALRYRGRGCRILYGATEHKSIFDTAQALTELEGVTSEEIPALSDGSTNLEALEKLLSKSKNTPTLVCIMHVNNEVPARHQVEDIAKLCKSYEAFFHCDGVQGFVRESVDFASGLFGSYVISAHKVYGPKGLGVLVLGDNDLSTRVMPPYHGGSQERGLRPGTVNMTGIVGAAKAISLHNACRDSRVRHMDLCARSFVEALRYGGLDFRLTVPLNNHAPGIVNFYIPDLDAPTVLAAAPDLCINRGSSCIGAGGERFSHVPKALGLPVEVQANVLRASFGDAITVSEAGEAGRLLADRINKLKNPR
jgi:cysteine desulfurase